ncbi:MAG: hypothetical protein RIQ40_539 [Planctomycetota bacterium]
MPTPATRRPRTLLVTSTIAAAGCAALLLAARPAANSLQDSRGKVVSITSESTPFGMSLFRLWSNGDIEVMVLGQNNTWTDWKGVAPGKSGYAPGNQQNN